MIAWRTHGHKELVSKRANAPISRRMGDCRARRPIQTAGAGNPDSAVRSALDGGTTRQSGCAAVGPARRLVARSSPEEPRLGVHAILFRSEAARSGNLRPGEPRRAGLATNLADGVSFWQDPEGVCITVPARFSASAESVSRRTSQRNRCVGPPRRPDRARLTRNYVARSYSDPALDAFARAFDASRRD